jgi:hypothetical protein
VTKTRAIMNPFVFRQPFFRFNARKRIHKMVVTTSGLPRFFKP